MVTEAVPGLINADVPQSEYLEPSFDLGLDQRQFAPHQIEYEKRRNQKICRVKTPACQHGKEQKKHDK